MAQESKKPTRGGGGGERRGNENGRRCTSSLNPLLAFLCQKLQESVSLFQSFNSSHDQSNHIGKNSTCIASNEEDPTSGAHLDPKPVHVFTNPNDSPDGANKSSDSSTLSTDPPIAADEPILQLRSVGPPRPKIDKGRKPPVH